MDQDPGQDHASVRYIVDDVDAAIAFYTDLLGFTVLSHPARRSQTSSGAT